MFKAIGRFFKALFKGAAKAVTSLFDFLGEFLKSARGKLLESIWDLAVECAGQIAANPTLTTDEDKRHAFERAMKKAVKEEGKELSDSILNIARELAVQYVKTH